MFSYINYTAEIAQSFFRWSIFCFNMGDDDDLQLQLMLDENLIALATFFLTVQNKRKQKRKRCWWVHPVLRRRKQQGSFILLIKELMDDDARFHLYFRMSKNEYSDILTRLVQADLTKFSKFRQVISPNEKLAVCLR